MYNPGWRHICDLKFTNGLVIAAPHEHTHYSECREGNSHKQNLLWRMIEKEGEYKANDIRDFNHDEFPGLFCIFREKQASDQIAQIEQCAAIGPDEEKVQNEKQTSAALHQEKVFVAFALK